jgi:hypothetical protein
MDAAGMITSFWFCYSGLTRAAPEPVSRHHRGGDPQVRWYSGSSLPYESEASADTKTLWEPSVPPRRAAAMTPARLDRALP